MYVHIGIIGRDKTIQFSLALFVIVSNSVTLGERAYNKFTGWVVPSCERADVVLDSIINKL